jgi:hypothetical protein
MAGAVTPYNPEAIAPTPTLNHSPELLNFKLTPNWSPPPQRAPRRGQRDPGQSMSYASPFKYSHVSTMLADPHN